MIKNFSDLRDKLTEKQKQVSYKKLQIYSELDDNIVKTCKKIYMLYGKSFTWNQWYYTWNPPSHTWNPNTLIIQRFMGIGAIKSAIPLYGEISHSYEFTEEFIECLFDYESLSEDA